MSKKKIETKILSEDRFPEWNRLVVSSPSGSVYSRTDYLDALCSVTGGYFKVLAAYKGEEMLGGIALYEQKRGIIDEVTNRILLYYNGIVLQDHPTKYPSEATSRALEVMDALEEALSQLHYDRIRFRNRHTIDDIRVFASRGWKIDIGYSYEVDIADLDVTWSTIAHNLRRLVRRCESGDFEFTEDDDLDSFYELHREIHERKGAPLYLPKALFKKYFESLKANDLCRLFHLRTSDGKSVATQLVLLGEHPVTHTVSAAANDDFMKHGVNPYLRWRVFQSLSELGYKANDLTDADLNPVAKFKSQLGGRLVTNLTVSRENALKCRSNRLIERFAGRGISLLRKVGVQRR